MKLQCSCGAKYEFELRPEMREHPVQFVCPACGADASQFVDGLVRRELGQSSAPSGAPVSALEPGLHAVPASALRLSGSAPEPESPRLAREMPRCSKHPGEVAAEKCYVCSKPICSKCMELFGYVCSPLCKAKAASHGIQLPIYEGQKSVLEARRWRKIVWAGSSAAVLLVTLCAAWLWYSFFGCQPKLVFAVRFPEPAYSGQSALVGKDKDQLVFLHGATLARYDLRSKKEMWSRRVVDDAQIQRAVDLQAKANKAFLDKANSEAWENIPRMPSGEQLTRDMQKQAAAALALHVRGQNIWVAAPERLVLYDWDTGKPAKELPVQGGPAGLVYRGDELLLVETDTGKAVVTHIDLLSGNTRKEQLGDQDANVVGQSAVRSGAQTAAVAGLPPAAPRSDTGKVMDPAKVAAQAQRLSLPEKIALPAVLAGNMNQQRALKELDDSGRQPAPQQFAPITGGNLSLIPTKNGFVEFTVRLLESRIVSRSAMKSSGSRSVLDGDVTAGKSMEMSSDLLNEMQRSNGGDTVQEDHSRYQVTLRTPGAEASWTGDVVGPPKLYPLDSVNVLTADKLIIVFDKAQKKIWQSSLNYNVVGGLAGLDEESATYGQGPCVERKGTLYVFDEGVLSAFELATGNARWRLPSVGIAGLFFNDQDMIYVNTTSASHDSLKYSRQIDLSQKVRSIILKLDPSNGKILWSAESKGLVNYVSGRFVLAAQSSIPEDTEEADTGLEKKAWMRIRRISPNDGREVWEHYQERAPLDIAFDKNTIRLVFKKEVQVLRFPRF